MTPRAYRMEARRLSAEATRARIVASARGLLSAKAGIAAFTIDAVAHEADVARMTVYHGFGSKSGLIEAVFDSLAIVRVGVPRLVAALELADPLETLSAFIATFAEVWQADRVVIRRLQGLAAIDREFARIWRRREERRRDGLRTIAGRVAERRGAAGVSYDTDVVTDVLFALVAFETYDVIAGPERRLETIAPVVEQLARKALGVGEPGPVRARMNATAR
jgi:AcrR family transcriptional regulator